MKIELSCEQMEKAKACKSVEELLSLAKENEIEVTEAEAKNYFAKLNPENGELSDNELETISGGCGEPKMCPRCYSYNTTSNDGGEAEVGTRVTFYRCLDCYCQF